MQTNCTLSIIYGDKTLYVVKIHSVTLDSEYGGEGVYNFDGAAKLKYGETGLIDTYEISGKVFIKEENGDSMLKIVGDVSARNKR